jgi:hypothetical protein
MDVLTSPPELSSEIQRALQQAVGQANNAFTSHQLIDQPKTAKRKRDKDKEGRKAIKQKKKKKKAAAEAAHVSPRESSSIPASHRSSAQSQSGKKATSKRSSRVIPNPANANEPLVPSSPSQAQSPESFLNAVASAASATSVHSESPYDLSQPCFDPQSSSSYPYPTMPNDLSLGAGGLQPPDSLSNTTVPDLNYASNDDILRALQDLDVTKIATVLKTLGEAAAAANLPLSLTSLPSTLLQRPHATTPIDPSLSNSPAVAESSAPRVPQHHRRIVDTRREPLGHSDHAVLLATKWLNAQKLAELAKTEGQCYAMSFLARSSVPSIATGLVYKKGKFSAIEEQQLSDAIQTYKEVRSATSKAKLPLINTLLRKTGLMTRVSLILCLLKMTKRRIPRSGPRLVRTRLPTRVPILILSQPLPYLCGLSLPSIITSEGSTTLFGHKANGCLRKMHC